MKHRRADLAQGFVGMSDLREADCRCWVVRAKNLGKRGERRAATSILGEGIERVSEGRRRAALDGWVPASAGRGSHATNLDGVLHGLGKLLQRGLVLALVEVTGGHARGETAKGD